MPKITMRDIAERLNLSRFAVSRALSGGEGVSEETRRRVKEVAEELGYIPLNSERIKDHFRTRNILFMVRQSRIPDQYFWPMVIAGAESATKKRRLNLIITLISPEEEEKGILPPAFAQHNIDGALAVGEFERAFLEALSEQKQPVILLDIEGWEYDLDAVVTADREGGFMAVRHLYNLGHRNIGFAGDLTYASSFNRRYQGYLQAMSQYGLTGKQELSFDYLKWDTPELKEKLTNTADLATGFVCASDHEALALVNSLTELGKKVPDEFSVVGFDNTILAVKSIPALTTVNVFKERMGERAIELLEWRIKNPSHPRETVAIEVEFVQRDSTGPVRSVSSASKPCYQNVT